MRKTQSERRLRRSPITVAAIVIAATSVGGATAATLHRFAVTSTTGSGGATAFVQSTATGGALQGEVAGSANQSIRIPFGILGEYNAAGSTFGVGVAGISTTGYAVGAESLGGSPAVLALNAGTADGIDAFAKANSGGFNGPVLLSGAYGESDGNYGNGVYGYDKGTSDTNGLGVGVYGESHNGAGIVAANDTNGSSFVGATTNGRGAVALGTSGGFPPAIAAISGTRGTDVLHGAVTYSTSAPSEVEFDLQGTSQNRSGKVITTNAASDLQMNGDLYITGGIYSGCSDFPTTTSSTCTEVAASSVARSNDGNMVRSYPTMHARPTLEDDGEAQLSAGFTHVTLDPTFARAISLESPYTVLVTPEGDNALYVTHKTRTGFDVRTIGATRVTMPFGYRIVARPFDGASRHMAIEGRHPVAMHAVENLDPRELAPHGRAHRMTAPRTLLSTR